MATILSRLAGSVLGLLFPLSCVSCGRQGRFLCESCEATLPRLTRPYCSTCAAPGLTPLCQWCAVTPSPIDGIRTPYLMEGAVRQLFHELKYRNLRAGAPELGELLATFLLSNPLPADVLIPVPLHPRRERERGYNQSALLARELSRLTGVPVEGRVLQRIRDTPPQISLESLEERRRNTEGVFQCTSDLVGRMVLLIDDVVTTGSTMFSCASALKDSGARSVWGLALARQA